MTKQLGKLEKIDDLRSIWKHEAKDFTPWLAEEERRRTPIPLMKKYVKYIFALINSH